MEYLPNLEGLISAYNNLQEARSYIYNERDRIENCEVTEKIDSHLTSDMAELYILIETEVKDYFDFNEREMARLDLLNLLEKPILDDNYSVDDLMFELFSTGHTIYLESIDSY